MRLRQLELKDAEGMLAWMQDPQIMQYFRFDASDSNLENAENFIKEAQQLYQEKTALNYAIVDAEDRYLGTVSLKNIDYESENAEYAICLSSQAHGKGIGYFATAKILEIAFEELKLQRVYLNVLSHNRSAIRLYSKIGFVLEGEFRNHLKLQGAWHSLKWFAMMRDEYERIFYDS